MKSLSVRAFPSPCFPSGAAAGNARAAPLLRTAATTLPRFSMSRRPSSAWVALRGQPAVPFVGSVSCLASSGDTIVAVVGISLANRSFEFQKQGKEFVAHYRVELSAEARGRPPVIWGRSRRSGFGPSPKPSGRTRASCSRRPRAPPGPHRLSVTVRDKSTGNPSRTEGSFDAPAFSPRSLSRDSHLSRAPARPAASRWILAQSPGSAQLRWRHHPCLRRGVWSPRHPHGATHLAGRE